MECIVREWKIEDAAGLAEMLNNKNILNNLRDGLPYPYTKKDAEEYIISMLSADKTKTFAFAIKVYCDSWKTAYQNLLPQTYLDLLTVEDCTPDKVSERDVVLVGYGSVLGICHISEARDRDNKAWGEVVAIYLLPEIWGSGQGSELLRYALGKLKKNGFRNICLWVMKGNIRARKFYEKNGFQISGNEREIEIAECRVSEVEYIYYG